MPFLGTTGPRDGRLEKSQARQSRDWPRRGVLRSCHRGRLLALLFYIAPYKKSVCSEDGAGKKGERHPHRKNPSHRSNQPKKYWVASLTLIQAIVATRTLPANTSSSKRTRCALFQRANDGGPFRQVLRKRWRSFSPGTALGSPDTALGSVPCRVQRGRMLLVPRLRTLEPVLSAAAAGRF